MYIYHTNCCEHDLPSPQIFCTIAPKQYVFILWFLYFRRLYRCCWQCHNILWPFTPFLSMYFKSAIELLSAGVSLALVL